MQVQNAAILTTSIKSLMKGSDFLAVHFTKENWAAALALARDVYTSIEEG